MTDRHGAVTFHIEPAWLDVLRAHQLDTFETLMRADRGECLRSHGDRGDVVRVDLADGQAIYVKRDYFVTPKEVFRDVIRFRPARPLVAKELDAIRIVRSMGIAAPEVAAFGQRRRRGLPVEAVLVTAPLPGEPLSRFLSTCEDAERRQVVLRGAGEIIARLYRAGLSWPGLYPKHFYVQDDLSLGLLDVNFSWSPFWQVRLGTRKHLGRFLRAAVRAGATPTDLAALRAGLGRPLASVRCPDESNRLNAEREAV